MSDEHDHDGIIEGRSYEPQVRLLMDRTAGMQRGTLISRAQFAEWTGEAVDGHRLNGLIKAFCARHMKERNIEIKSERLRGYRLALPTDQIDSGSQRLTKGLKQIRRGREAVAAVPDAELDAKQRDRKLRMSTALASLEGSLRKQRDVFQEMQAAQAAKLRARALPGPQPGA